MEMEKQILLGHAETRGLQILLSFPLDTMSINEFSIFVSQGNKLPQICFYCNKLPQTQQFKEVKFYCLTILEARSPTSNCEQGQIPSRDFYGRFHSLPFQACGGGWHPLASHQCCITTCCITPMSASMAILLPCFSLYSPLSVSIYSPLCRVHLDNPR